MSLLLEIPRTAEGKPDLRQFHMDQAAGYRATAAHYKEQLLACDRAKDPVRWDHLARKVNAAEIEASLQEGLAESAK